MKINIVHIKNWKIVRILIQRYEKRLRLNLTMFTQSSLNQKILWSDYWIIEI